MVIIKTSFDTSKRGRHCLFLCVIITLVCQGKNITFTNLLSIKLLLRPKEYIHIYLTWNGNLGLKLSYAILEEMTDVPALPRQAGRTGT